MVKLKPCFWAHLAGHKKWIVRGCCDAILARKPQGMPHSPLWPFREGCAHKWFVLHCTYFMWWNVVQMTKQMQPSIPLSLLHSTTLTHIPLQTRWGNPLPLLRVQWIPAGGPQLLFRWKAPQCHGSAQRATEPLHSRETTEHTRQVMRKHRFHRNIVQNVTYLFAAMCCTHCIILLSSTSNFSSKPLRSSSHRMLLHALVYWNTFLCPVWELMEVAGSKPPVQHVTGLLESDGAIHSVAEPVPDTAKSSCAQK